MAANLREWWACRNCAWIGHATEAHRHAGSTGHTVYLQGEKHA